MGCDMRAIQRTKTTLKIFLIFRLFGGSSGAGFERIDIRRERLDDLLMKNQQGIEDLMKGSR
jgi:hypothetical protein